MWTPPLPASQPDGADAMKKHDVTFIAGESAGALFGVSFDQWILRKQFVL